MYNSDYFRNTLKGGGKGGQIILRCGKYQIVKGANAFQRGETPPLPRSKRNPYRKTTALCIHVHFHPILYTI